MCEHDCIREYEEWQASWERRVEEMFRPEPKPRPYPEKPLDSGGHVFDPRSGICVQCGVSELTFRANLKYVAPRHSICKVLLEKMARGGR
jgi:hypothetical protein